jgi:hypothetical protein
MPIIKVERSMEQVCASVGKQLAIKGYNLRLQAVKKLAWTFSDPDIEDEVKAAKSLEYSCDFDELSRKSDRLHDWCDSIVQFTLKLKRAVREHDKRDDPAYALNVMIRHIEDTFVASDAFEKTHRDVVKNAVRSMMRESGRPFARLPPVGMTFDEEEDGDSDSDDDDI